MKTGFTAVVTLMPTIAGGRENPIFGGYRPNFTWEHDKYYSCELLIQGADFLNPGEKGLVQIKPLKIENCQDLKVDQIFHISEGKKIIGTGKIITIE